MPVDDVAAQNAFLDNTLGPDRGVATPASLDIAMFMGDPRNGGVEVTTAGATRIAWDSDDWGPADEGGTETTSDVVFPDPSAAYPDTVTHWAGYDSTTRWFSGRIVTPIDVTAASGDGVAIRPALAFDDATAG